MSSALDAIFSQGVSALHASGHSRWFRIQSPDNGGKMFAGTLRTESVLDPELLLGSDPRERVWLDVPSEVNYLKSQMVLQEGRMVAGQFRSDGEPRWKVISQESNPADVENKYELIKLIDGDK